MPVPAYIKALRRQIGHDLLLLPSVAALVTDSAARVLVVRNSAAAAWTLPGGLVEPGERPVEALIREVREESGALIAPSAVLGVFGGPDGFQRTYANGDQIECVEILFYARSNDTSVCPRDDEMLEARFLPVDSLIDWQYPIPAKLLSDAALAGKTVVWLSGAYTPL